MRLAEPSDRNYTIFTAIEFERQSPHKLANQHGISVGRVQEIVAQVRQWFASTTSNWVGSLPVALQPLVAAHLFDERLTHLSREANEAWEASKGPISVTRKSAGSNSPGVTTTTNSAGQARYLAIGARLAKIQLEGALRLGAWRLAHKELEPQLAEILRQQEQTQEQTYARDDEEVEEQPLIASEGSLLTPTDDEAYDDNVEADDEIATPIFSAPAPMRAARKERRRRQRELERARRKKAK
jgi:hypothetical protein